MPPPTITLPAELTEVDVTVTEHRALQIVPTIEGVAQRVGTIDLSSDNGDKQVDSKQDTVDINPTPPGTLTGTVQGQRDDVGDQPSLKEL